MAKKDGVRFEWDGRITNYNKYVVQAVAVGAAANAGRRAINEIQEIISAAGRVDTGELLRSFSLKPIMTVLGPSVTIESDSPHAYWVDKGTGIYGPKGRPITRPGGGAMKFNPGRRSSGGGTGVGRRAKTTSFGKAGQFSGTAYATAVSGQTPVNFYEKAQQRMNITWWVNPF